MTEAQSGVLSERGALHAAYDCGYLVLLAALPDEAAMSAQDHPSVDLVRRACHVLGLSEVDSTFAEDFAIHYYTLDLSVTLNDCLSWAKRVRSIAGLA
jgi:hypothetical protein